MTSITPAMSVRHAVVLLHRYAGLAAALFLISAGLTGSLLVWNDPLEKLFAPQLFIPPPHDPATELRDPFELEALVAQRFTKARVSDVPLRLRADKTAIFGLDYPAESMPAAADDQVFVDPSDGKILGTRRSGDLKQGLKNVMPFIYSIHETLVLGNVGTIVLGAASLLWALQCFTGGYLTLPITRKASTHGATPGTKSWGARWGPSWTIRTHRDLKKITFDVHRAGGLWLWALLFVFAASAMSFTLTSVYQPVVRSLLGYSDRFGALDNRDGTDAVPLLTWREAYAAGVGYAERVALERNFRVLSERLMMYHDAQRIYEYRVQSSLDVEARGNTRFYIDADSGQPRGYDLPTEKLGNWVTTWIEALHETMVFGLPYKVTITLFGLCVAASAVTGTLIWAIKRSPTRKKKQPRRLESRRG